MQHIDQNVTGNSSDFTQLALWSADDLPEVQQSEQAESEDGLPLPLQENPPAIQLYLPGFESK